MTKIPGEDFVEFFLIIHVYGGQKLPKRDLTPQKRKITLVPFGILLAVRPMSLNNLNWKDPLFPKIVASHVSDSRFKADAIKHS